MLHMRQRGCTALQQMLAANLSLDTCQRIPKACRPAGAGDQHPIRCSAQCTVRRSGSVWMVVRTGCLHVGHGAQASRMHAAGLRVDLSMHACMQPGTARTPHPCLPAVSAACCPPQAGGGGAAAPACRGARGRRGRAPGRTARPAAGPRYPAGEWAKRVRDEWEGDWAHRPSGLYVAMRLELKAGAGGGLWARSRLR